MASLLGCVFRSLRVMTRHAIPVLFTINMGTGVVSSLFMAFPYGRGSTAMLVFSQIFFFFNLVSFVSFLVLSIAKYITYPETLKTLLKNPVTSLYAGCLPMAATTLLNVAVEIFHDRHKIGGKFFLQFLWAVWWIDVVISFLCCWVGVHVMMTNQTHSLESMTATWLLPVVTLIVASSTGGILSRSLQEYSTTLALDTLVVSVFMVTVGLSLALMVMVIYLQRLIMCGIPTGRTLLSVFIPLGPTGQAGYSMLLIGKELGRLLPRVSSGNSHFLTSHPAPMIIEVACICASFILWSLGTMWTLFGFLAVYSGSRRSVIPFEITFWGLVFPNGVYANLTIQLADLFDSAAFRVWGALYAIGTLCLWLWLSLRSTWEIRTFFVGMQEDLHLGPKAKQVSFLHMPEDGTNFGSNLK